MTRSRRARRPPLRASMHQALCAVAVVAALAGVPATAAADPAPPPNPGNSQLDAASADARNQAKTVDGLTVKLTDAQAQLDQLRQQLELTMELANKTRVDLTSAQEAANLTDAAHADAQKTRRRRSVRQTAPSRTPTCRPLVSP